MIMAKTYDDATGKHALVENPADNDVLYIMYRVTGQMAKFQPIKFDFSYVGKHRLDEFDSFGQRSMTCPACVAEMTR